MLGHTVLSDPSSGSTGLSVCLDLSTVLFIPFFSAIENRQEDSSAAGGVNMASLVRLVGHNLQNMCLKYPGRKGKDQSSSQNASQAFLPSGHTSYIHIVFCLGPSQHYRIKLTDQWQRH